MNECIWIRLLTAVRMKTVTDKKNTALSEKDEHCQKKRTAVKQNVA